ncbi:MAG TPA: MarC family protein [Stellaceae bacterium]|nr:MarC family protein [Stellaceae bacterium]
MNRELLYSFVTLLVIVDPLGTAVMFMGLTPNAAPAHRRDMAWRGTLIATAIILVFAIAGRALLEAMDISLAAFRIAGGLLLFLLATDMVLALHTGIRGTTGPEQEEAERSRDVAVFPLAIPLLAGPGALTSITLLMGSAHGVWAQAWVLAALAVVMLLTLLALVAAARVARLLGVTGANVVTRVLGIVLAALATQYVIDGVRESLSLG